MITNSQLIFVAFFMGHLPMHHIVHDYTTKGKFAQFPEMSKVWTPNMSSLNSWNYCFVNFSWIAFATLSNLNVFMIRRGNDGHNIFSSCSVISSIRCIIVCYFGLRHASVTNHTIKIL